MGGKFYHSTKTYSLKALAYAIYYSEIISFNFKTGVARRWVVVEVDFQTKIGLPWAKEASHTILFHQFGGGGVLCQPCSKLLDLN